jgi:transposase
VITDGHGTPPAVLLTGGNRNDVTQLLPLLDAVPPVRGRVGRPRRRPDSLFADRGYDHDVYRDQVRARGIVPAIARRGTLHGTGLGTYRWVVERTTDNSGHCVSRDSRLRTSLGVRLQPTRRGPLQLMPITSPSRAASGST